MTTSGLQFDRELKTAASQICSSVKSGKRNWLSTLLVIFHYLLYLLTVKGFFIFFRSIHPITPTLIPLFIGSWEGLAVSARQYFLNFFFFLTTCTQMQSFSPPFILISCISDRYITSLRAIHFLPWSSRADRTAGGQLSSQLEYLLHILCFK